MNGTIKLGNLTLANSAIQGYSLREYSDSETRKVVSYDFTIYLSSGETFNYSCKKEIHADTIASALNEIVSKHGDNSSSYNWLFGY